MSANLNMRKLLLTIILVVGLVAVAVPVCQMVNCTMSANGMPSSPGVMLKSACDGLLLTNTGPVGSLPPNSQSLLLLMFVALFAAATLVRPQLATRRVRVVDEDPPSPPEDPRGERLLL